MSRCFVLDEWIFHYMVGEKGLDGQQQVGRLLRRMKEICDHIAVLKGSTWARKSYEVMRSADVRVQGLSKYLHQVMLQDPAKSRLLHPEAQSVIPEEVLPLIPPDDVYLFEICYQPSLRVEALVTTDGRLRERLKAIGGMVPIVLKDDFLRTYLDAQ